MTGKTEKPPAAETGKQLRRGYTTGTSAAAAARAAALWLLDGRPPAQVTIQLPDGAPVTLPVHTVKRTDTSARCFVVKDAGDDPDVTNGAAIHALVEFCSVPGVAIDGGEGVGRVTRPGLPLPVGEAAINPVPRMMIARALSDLVSRAAGWKVTIIVPEGAVLARRTFNPRLGITGGISIIGTTGYVEPRSLEALKRSLPPLLDVVRAAGYRSICLVPGNIGRRAARRLRHPPEEAQIVEFSDFLGFMLDEADKRGFYRIMLVGHTGKLAKVLNGDWQTHSKYSSPANRAVIRFFVEAGLPESLAVSLEKLPTVEAIQQTVVEEGYAHLLGLLAGRIRALVRKRLQHRPEVSVHLCDLAGNILGEA